MSLPPLPLLTLSREVTSSFLACGLGLLETLKTGDQAVTLHFFFCGEGGASAIMAIPGDALGLELALGGLIKV